MAQFCRPPPEKMFSRAATWAAPEEPSPALLLIHSPRTVGSMPGSVMEVPMRTMTIIANVKRMRERSSGTLKLLAKAEIMGGSGKRRWAGRSASSEAARIPAHQMTGSEKNQAAMEPPAFSIFSRAAALTFAPSMVSLRESSPLPSTLIESQERETSPISRRAASLTTAPS